MIETSTPTIMIIIEFRGFEIFLYLILQTVHLYSTHPVLSKALITSLFILLKIC